MLAHGGFEVAFHGEYREIVTDERIVSTEVFEAMPDEEAVNTVTFTEDAGATTLAILVQHSSQGIRDAHIASGMEAGMQEVDEPSRAGGRLTALAAFVIVDREPTWLAFGSASPATHQGDPDRPESGWAGLVWAPRTGHSVRSHWIAGQRQTDRCRATDGATGLNKGYDEPATHGTKGPISVESFLSA